MARTLRVLFDDALALNPAGTGTFTRGIQTPLSRLDGIELIPAGWAARPHQLDIVNKGVLRRMRNGKEQHRCTGNEKNSYRTVHLSSPFV